MHEIHLIIGLPGSGKTHFSETLGVHLVDDISDLGQLPDADVGSFAITDPYFCQETTLQSAKAELERRYPHHRLRLHFFENDPEKCLLNVAHRNDGRRVEGLIELLAQAYEPENPMKIWQP